MKVRISHWPGPPPRTVAFTGITCNLACVLCGPGASSKWRAELGLGKYTSAEHTFCDDEVEVEIEQYDFSKVSNLTFGGGEPLLNESTMLILERLNTDATVNFHVNGTIKPSQAYLDQFAKFKNFIITFSIDDTEERFEYLRWPAKWNEVANNIIWYGQNCPSNVKFAFNVVLSRFNESTYLSVKDWMTANLPKNKNGYPTEFYVQESNDFLNRNIEVTEHDMRKLGNIDKRRNISWQKVFPLVKL